MGPKKSRKIPAKFPCAKSKNSPTSFCRSAGKWIGGGLSEEDVMHTRYAKGGGGTQGLGQRDGGFSFSG